MFLGVSFLTTQVNLMVLKRFLVIFYMYNGSEFFGATVIAFVLNFRTSYSLMSQWMNRKGSAQAYRKEPLPQTFAIAMQGNAAFPTRNPAFSAGSARQYEPGRSLDFVRNMTQSMEQLPTYDDPDPVNYNVTAPNAAVR